MNNIEIVTINNAKLLQINKITESICGLYPNDDFLLNYMYEFDNYVKDNYYVLMFGGGGYAWPKHFLKHFNGKIDVVEINPKITQIAKDFFFLENNNRLNIIHDDFRSYIKKKVGPYDLIINDAFIGEEPIYANMSDISNILKQDGIYIQNIIGCPQIKNIIGNNTIISWTQSQI